MKLIAKLSLGYTFTMFVVTGSLAQGFSPATEAALQTVLQNFQDNPNYVGGISAAIKVDGVASWKGATGFASRNVDADNNLLPGGSAFQTSTLSRIYSITKTFTAALILELASEGKINLNATVSTYYPIQSVNPGLNSNVTVRQLLAHESGYSDYVTEFQFQLAVAFQPTRVWQAYEVLYFISQQSQPGSVRKYSSSNYVLLGAIIEAVTSKPVEQHFRERFITPLGLSSMYFSIRESQPAGTVLAAPHDNISPFNPIFQLTGQPTFPNAYTNISAFPLTGILSAAFTGGAMVSSASDVAEWGNSLFTGQATSPATIDSMLNSISTTPDAQGDYLGYGIWRSSKMSNTESFYGHDGNAPGYRSLMYFQPDKRITIAVLVNFAGADIYAIAKALYAVIPAFSCGNENRKDDKVMLCLNGSPICVDRNAAHSLVRKGAYLGACDVVARSNQPFVNNELSTGAITATPNPYRNNLTISFTAQESGNHTVTILDSRGSALKHIFAGSLNKGEIRKFQVHTSEIPAGLHVLSITSPKGVTSKKLLRLAK